jgi:seryl-tRNA synthetase
MLSIDYIRENKEKVIEAAKNKNREFDLNKLLLIDDKRRELIQEVQKIREERNKLAATKNVDEIREKGKELKENLKKIEDELRTVEEEFNKLMLFVPNVPLDEVPVGKDENDNVEIKKEGLPREFDFPPLSHVELGQQKDLIDTQRGSKISGFRGYFLKNKLAQLQFALLFYTFQKLASKGYTPIIAPSVIKEFTLFGSGHFPWGRVEDVYKLNDDSDDAYLSGTAEIPVTAYHSGEILEEKDLPLRYVALSPCFRREAGAYGKDTSGIFRVHEFWKIEQVIIAPNNIEMAKELHEELQRNTEEIIQDMELPYRVMLMCTGDMGEPQIKKYDTEVWLPSQQKYRELASNSIMGDFQARRLNIKYRNTEGKTEFCYTLNDTAIPSTRSLIAIMENHQQQDGSIKIPKALQNLVGFSTI